MNSQSIRCLSCGHEEDSDSVRQKYGGACPHCIGAFALEGLLTAKEPTPVPSGGEFGRFMLTDRLGKGGMGEVWKAFDKELNRWVALKFLRGESPQELARFQREARTAAALGHPGIAAIYEVGEANGRHYIAMQYVEGRTLQMHPRKDRKGLARLIRDAARALEHAHKHGVIHRDLKPDNLMVEQVDNESRVMILDFGLAKRIQGGESLSQSGTVAGTLAYMSPEQARGEKLDERTDVYSLGATLYEVLTGKPPFEGANAYEVMRRIEDTEPTTPRRLNQHIPHDLETVTLKCLEKDKERRYGSAKDLADDLDRFLDGDAIMARRASTWYRVRMRLSKRKAVVITACAASVVLGAFIGWWALVGSPETRQARLMAEALKLWAEARGEAMAGVNPKAIATKANVARKAFERALTIRETPEALMMKGRCLTLEGKNRESLASLERAHELAPDLEDTRLELAQSLYFAYSNSRGMPGSSGGHANEPFGKLSHTIDPLPPESHREIQWRRRAGELLKGLSKEGAQTRLLEGLLAMGREDFGNAADHFAAYCTEERWDIHAHRLEGLCRFFAKEYLGATRAFTRVIDRVPDAIAFNFRGLTKEIQGQHQEAILDYTSAIEASPELAGPYSNRGSSWHSLGEYERAIADHSAAIRVEPNYARPYVNRANAYCETGRPDLALEDLNRALTLERGDPSAYVNRAALWFRMGRYAEVLQDCNDALRIHPRLPKALVNRAGAKCRLNQFDDAIADCNEALSVDPQFGLAYVTRGSAKYSKGLLDEAILDWTEAIKLDPGFAMAYSNRAEAKIDKGLHAEAIQDLEEALKRGRKTADILQSLGISYNKLEQADKAIEFWSAALTLEPQRVETLALRGQARVHKGLIEEGAADIELALKLDPNNALAYGVRAEMWQAKGESLRAIQDYSQVLTLEPYDETSLLGRGWLRAKTGAYQLAMEDYEKALKANPKSDGAYLNRGALYCDNLEKFDEAIADFTRAIELNPKNAKAFDNRGIARQGQNKYRDAIPDHSEAIRLQPTFEKAYSNRGIAWAMLGNCDQAIEDLETALRLKPDSPLSLYHLGNCRMSRGHFDKAVECYAKALECAPTDWELLKETRDKCNSAQAQLQFDSAEKAYHAKNYRESIEAFSLIVDKWPDSKITPVSAYNVACCYALLQEKTQALDWLQKSIDLGYKDLPLIEKDPDLDSIRGEKRYSALIAQLRGK